MIKVLIRNARAGAVDLAAAEQQRMDETAEQQRMDVAAEQQRMDETAEQQRMDETAEQQRMDVAAAVAAKVISYATNLLNF